MRAFFCGGRPKKVEAGFDSSLARLSPCYQMNRKPFFLAAMVGVAFFIGTRGLLVT